MVKINLLPPQLRRRITPRALPLAVPRAIVLNHPAPSGSLGGLRDPRCFTLGPSLTVKAVRVINAAGETALVAENDVRAALYDKYFLCRQLAGEVDYSPSSFPEKGTLPALCDNIRKTLPGLTDYLAANTLDELNILLRFTALYDIWSTKMEEGSPSFFNSLRLPPKLKQLAADTAAYRQRSYDSLTPIERHTIKQLNRQLIDFFFGPIGKTDFYIIDEKASGQHLRQILEYELGTAQELMDRSQSPETAEHRKFFLALAAEIVERQLPIRQLRHYGFMIEEAAKAGGDYLTAIAILLHNCSNKEAHAICDKLAHSSTQKKISNSALATRRRFLALNNVFYRPPKGAFRHLILNFIDGLICISEGDGRALLIRLVQRLSDVVVSRNNDEEMIASIHQVCAPIAERFGLIDLSRRLHSEAYRLQFPEQYETDEKEIVTDALGFQTRAEAVAWLNEIKNNLEQAAEQAGHSISNLPYPRSRIKLPYSAHMKTEIKPDQYFNIIFMPDLAGVYCISAAPLHASLAKRDLKVALDKAIKLVGSTMGPSIEFCYDHQTETKVIEVGKRRVAYHHVVVRQPFTRPDGIPDYRQIEFQFMDQETFLALARELKPHWAYKLSSETNQEFDLEVLEACGKLMNGDLFHDVAEIYEYLSARWSYIYFVDPKSPPNDPRQRVIRRRKGALPIDVASLVLQGNLSHYNGVKVKKVWEHDRRPNPFAENRPLVTGDFVEILNNRYRANPLEILPMTSEVKHADSVLAVHLAQYSDQTRITKAENDRCQRLAKNRKKEAYFNHVEFQELARHYAERPTALLQLINLKNEAENLLAFQLRKARRRYDHSVLIKMAQEFEVKPFAFLALLAIKNKLVSISDVVARMPKYGS